jgi:DNA-binding XRE family transcriptional regulator
MKMSAKEQYHRDFLNSLRERLNVDDKTIANLEKRITGKYQPNLALSTEF